MKRKLILAIVAVAVCGCANAHAEDSVLAITAATNAFSLTCVLVGSDVHCALRNVTTNTIPYSSYTIGYHETVVLERYEVWSAIITYRGDSVRIISVRPASRKEVELYEGEGI